MAPGVRWLVDRLRAMSPREIAYRSWRAATHPLRDMRLRHVKVPADVERWRGPPVGWMPTALFDAGSPTRLRDLADRIDAGEREVLGLGVLRLPEPRWQLEPRLGPSWPRMPSARLLAATPPGFDARLTWELNRGHDWVVLAAAHAQTGEARYRKRLEIELEGWRADNPPGLGINWVSAMEAAIRICSLAYVAEAVGVQSGRMMFEHAAFVASHLSAFSSANNHLIVELVGLLVAGRLLAQPHWHELARDRLEREVSRQVYPDGVDAEMATHYHEFVLEALVLAVSVERAHGAPSPAVEQVVRAMASYLVAIRAGHVLGQGDSDDGRIVATLPSDYTDALVRSASSIGALAAPRSRWFGASGQIVVRSERLVATVDAGPFGYGALAAHAHCDALATNVALDGQRVLVDRGTFVYNGDRAERDRFRATAAHNTVQVTDREQARAVGPFLWGRRPSTIIERCELGDVDLIIAHHDGFAPALHRRTIVRSGDLLIVLDEIAAEPEPFVARFHLAPELAVTRMTEGAFAVAGAAQPLGWIYSSGSVSLTRTPHSDRYRSKIDAYTLVAAHERGARAIAAFGAGEPREHRAAARGAVSRIAPLGFELNGLLALTE